MRVGEIAYLKHEFRIIDYSLENEMLVIDVDSSADVRERIKIPLYISNLGIYLPKVDYIIPGDYLPVDHPDYYQIVNIVNSPMRVKHNGKLLQLRLDPSFSITGLYHLVDESTGEITSKNAQRRSREELEQVLEVMLNIPQEGNLLSGRITKIFLRNTQWNKLKFVKYLSDYQAYTMINWIAFAVIHDTGSHIEYEVECKLLATKST